MTENHSAIHKIGKIGKEYSRNRKKGVFHMNNWIDRIALILVVVGALNWGCIGLFRFDLVSWIGGGQGSVIARIIYTLVALAGLWCISLFWRPSEDRELAD